jgi:hypothetical protein
MYISFVSVTYTGCFRKNDDAGDVLFTGIPLAGDIDVIARRLESRGITFSSVSWKGAQQ